MNMKYTTLLFVFIILNLFCFSQTKENKMFYNTELIKSYNNNSLSSKKFLYINKTNASITNYAYIIKSNNKNCMWCFLAPVAAGVMFYQSYRSFKKNNKTDGFVALGLGTGFTVFSLVYFIPNKHSN